MTSRTLKCVALIFLGSIGSAALLTSTTPSHADDCLAAPKGATTQGGHWYYHLERGTGRKCWYLGTEGQKVSRNSDSVAQPSAQKKTASATPADTADEAADANSGDTTAEPMQPSVANARAELRAAARPAQPPQAQQAQVQAPAPVGLTPFPSIANTAVAASPSSTQTLGGRWPDTNAFRPTEQPYVIAQNTPAAPAQSEPQMQSQQLQAQPARTAQPVQVAQPQPVAVQPAPDASFSAGQIMLCAIFLILALAAVTAGVAYRYFGRLKVAPPEPARRHDIWGQYRDDRIPDYEQMVMPDRRIRTRQPAEPVDEIEYLLRRASQREARERHFSN